ncbi:macro domain-containing protein [Peptoniphilus lacrimalis]|uniref:macro domain-containing protein n=1 Tax=Peptoniphilus lacrimalis TaxID=33031 RepID=UPI0023F64612|nr:macro domain-containing protein [Peptoniphilus lacrimalis]MDK7722934.1 macro domain-containing protein [Peptoniphilus lacrimalis]MDK7732536.1 macro domain-containing protein [Peptoniphilus lacrimalis]
MSLNIKLENLVKMDVDAIVNAANKELLPGGGVCGAIFQGAKSKSLEMDCNKLGPIKTGQAVITGAYNLPSKYIIHAVGPIYRDGLSGEEEFLRNAYINSLKLAKKHSIKSIAFPLISAGIYGYPLKEACKIAVDTIREFLKKEDMDVTIAVLDPNIYDILTKL